MIEFNCSECGKKLKVTGDAAGKRGKCPQCGALLRVPETDRPAPFTHAVLQVVPSAASPAAPPVSEPQRPPSSVPAKVDDVDFDLHSRVAAWIGAAGLLLLALSPLFKWVKFGSGGVIGIRGDGKIVLAVTVLALVGFGVSILRKKRIRSLLLASQAWASIAAFWMAGLIWKAGGMFDDPEIRDNPFAGMLASQVSPGSGLYLGLIGALLAAGGRGFLAVRALSLTGKAHLYYISQGCAVVLGIAILLLVGPTRTTGGSSGAERPSMPWFGREHANKEANTIAIGQTLKLGNIEVRPLGVWKRTVKYVRESYFDTEKKLDETEGFVLVLAFEVTNHSTGEVFDPLGPGDAWDYSSVTDEYGNRSLAYKMFDLDLPSFQGRPKQDLQPGSKKNVMFLVDELSNPNATSFTWKARFIVSNKFSSEDVFVKFSAADVKP